MTLAPMPTERIFRKAFKRLEGRTSRSWQEGRKKYDSIIKACTPFPMRVASAAPDNPIFMGNTRNQSPNTFTQPPQITAAMASLGAPSFLRKAPREVGRRKTGRNQISHLA